MNYAHWHVGMKVVCLDGGGATDDVPSVPDTGEVCTVAWIGAVEGDVLIDLVEYPAPETDTMFRGFMACDFRPVQPRKTSIEVFHRIRLNPSIRIREDA